MIFNRINNDASTSNRLHLIDTQLERHDVDTTVNSYFWIQVGSGEFKRNTSIHFLANLHDQKLSEILLVTSYRWRLYEQGRYQDFKTKSNIGTTKFW